MKPVLIVLIFLVFPSCGPEKGIPDFDCVAFFVFNGWNQTKAYRVDSLGNVHILTINLKDSANSCFVLSKSQLDTVKFFVDSCFSVKINEDTSGSLHCNDCGITKMILRRQNKELEFNSERNTLPQCYINLATLIIKEAENAKKSNCLYSFGKTELTKGYEDLFRIPDKSE